VAAICTGSTSHAGGERAGEVLRPVAGLFAKGPTCVEEPLRTRDHGEVALRAFGAELSRQGNATGLSGARIHAIQAKCRGPFERCVLLLRAAFFQGRSW